MMLKKLKLDQILLIFFWFLVCCYVYISRMSGDFPFKDTDDYMRLVRVLEFIEGAGWYDHIMPRSNFPYGCDIHWTRLYDCILIAGSYIFRPFVNTSKDALFYFSSIISPIFGIFATLKYLQICKRFFQSSVSFLCGLFFLLNGYTFIQIAPCRPDHHALLILLAVLMLKYCLEMLSNMQTGKYDNSAIKLGITYSIGISASPELLLIICPMEAFLAIYYMATNYGIEQNIKKNSWWLVSIIACFFAFSFDSLANLSSPDYDKISIVHVAISASALMFWLTVRQIKFDDMTKRIYGSAFIGLTLVCLLYKIFPDIIYLMSGKVDPDVKKLWLQNVSEMSSPIKDDNIFTTFAYILPALCTLAGCYSVLTKMGNVKFDKKIMIVYTSAISILFTILTGITYRIGYYFAIFAIPFIVHFFMFSSIAERVKQRYRGHVCMLGFFMIFYALPCLIVCIWPENGEEEEKFDVKSMIQYLAEIDKTETILAHHGYGPKILYYTKHNIIGSPYHRQTYGLLSDHKVFCSETNDINDLLEIIKTSNVGYIVFDSKHNKSKIYKELQANCPSNIKRLDVKIDGFEIYKVENRVNDN